MIEVQNTSFVDLFICSGVATFYGYTLARWNNNENDPVLRTASFTSDTKPLTLECQVSIILVKFI